MSESNAETLLEMVREAVPAGDRPYINAQLSLNSMVRLELDDEVYAAKKAIEEAVEADINQEFDPPLSTPLSDALHSLHASRNSWTSHEYDGPFSPNKHNVDGSAVYAAEYLLAAIVKHGSKETFTSKDAQSMQRRLEVEIEGPRL